MLWFKKKSFVFFLFPLFSLFSFVLSGCSSSRGANLENRKSILSMNRMIHDCVYRIVKDKIETVVLIDGLIDPHSYEIVKGDEDKFAMSDLIICNGLGLEHSASLRKQIEGNPKVVCIGDRLAKRNAFTILEEEGVYDPHIWTDMHIWREGVKEVAEALIEAFPEFQEEFTSNTKDLLCEMQELDEWATRCLSTIPEKSRYLVSCHNAFSYLTRRYLASEDEVREGTWQEHCASPEGLSPESQISIRNIMVVAQYIRDHDVHVIFSEDTLNQDAIKKIVACLKNEHEIRVSKQALYSDNVLTNYFDTFKHNITVITQELGGVVE